MTAIINLDEYRQRAFPELAELMNGDDDGVTLIHEIDDGESDDSGVVWSWEMSRAGATLRLSVTDDGAVWIANERDLWDAETGSYRVHNTAYRLEGAQITAFGLAFGNARAVANGMTQS